MSVCVQNKIVSPVYSRGLLFRGPRRFRPPFAHNRVLRGPSKRTVTESYHEPAWGRGTTAPRSPPDDLDLKGKEVFFKLGSGAITYYRQDPAPSSYFPYLKQAGATGITIDSRWDNWDNVLWWAKYIKAAGAAGLKVQLNLMFNRLPNHYAAKLYNQGIEKSELFLQDKNGQHNTHYLSFGWDHKALPLIRKTGLEMMAEYVEASLGELASVLGDEWGRTLVDISVALGPDGDWLYPSSPAIHGEGAQWLLFFEQAGAPNWFVDQWRDQGVGSCEVQRAHTEHPGVGEYMCFDPLMLVELEEHARKLGLDAWGSPPITPGDGYYEVKDALPLYPPEPLTVTLKNGEHITDGEDEAVQKYWEFFLGWYHGRLKQHGEDVLDTVIPIIRRLNGQTGREVRVLTRLGGLYWSRWTQEAESRAGYFNRPHDAEEGYVELIQVLKERDVGVVFPCMEVQETPQRSKCPIDGPDLVDRITTICQGKGVRLVGENSHAGALENHANLDMMLCNAQHCQRLVLQRFDQMYHFRFALDDDGVRDLLFRFRDANREGVAEEGHAHHGSTHTSEATHH